MIKILKWELIARIKRRILETPILNKLPLSIIIGLLSIFSVFKFACSYILYDFIFNNAVTIPGEFLGVKDFPINRLNGILLFIFVISLAIDVIYTSHDFIIVKNTTAKFDNYVANTNYSYNKINLMMIITEVLWSMSSVIIVQTPFVLVILKQLDYSIPYTVTIVTLFIGINILLKYLFGIIFDFVIFNKKKLTTVVSYGLFIKIVLVGFTIKIGTQISPWIERFSLAKVNVNGDEFLSWLLEPFIYVDNFLNQSIISTIVNIRIIFIFFLSLCLVSFVIFEINWRSSDRKKRVIIQKQGYKKLKNKSFGSYYLQYCFRKIYEDRTFVYFFGPNSYWIILGLTYGILSSLKSDSIMFYFIIFQYTFVGTYFLTDDLLTKLSSIYLLSGEGKNIYFWRNVGFQELLLYKAKLFFFNLAFPVIIGSSILLICKLITFQLFAFTILFQLLYGFLYFLMKNKAYLLNILDEKLMFETDVEFKKTLQGKWLNDSVGLLYLVVILPIAAIPLAFYITGDIDKTLFIILHFFVHGFLILFICFSYFCYMRKKVNMLL